MGIKFDVCYSICLPLFSVLLFFLYSFAKQITLNLKFSIILSPALRKSHINNKIHAYNKNYKDPKEKYIMDFNVRNIAGGKSKIFILTKCYWKWKFIPDFTWCLCTKYRLRSSWA